MPAWVDHQFRTRDRSTKDGQYLLGTSRAVIVHEIVRGHWTWATAWSPDGSQLAVATENHHLAVLDTTSSTVWRVRHDKKIQGPVKQGTTHSIRAIAWGANYIAIGGTGNAVSILSPVEPYNVLQTIPNCGFVGSLHWRPDSNYLVIGSRLDRAIIARVRTATTTPPATACSTAAIDILGAFQPQASVLCETLHTVERKHWVNAVAFSRSGKYLAIGDAGGYLLVYNVHEASVSGLDAPIDEKKELVGLVKSFALDDSVLAVEWSPEGSWLYAGGEDFTVTVIETQYWEVVHKIKRDRWVQCIAASHSGTHVAVGGVSSEVSLLDTTNGWDSVMGIELNGLVPLSAIWHPQDQFLSLTGQNNSIVVVETTNARHVRGHHLHSVGGILAVEFSPDGRMAAVGNDSGVVAFYSLSGASFVTAYELVVTVENDRLSIKWSKNGLFVLIATRDSLLIVGRKRRDRYGKAVPSKCAGFSIRKVVKDLSGCHAVSIDLQSQYISVVGSKGTSILDVSRDFSVAREWLSGPCYATAWSPLGRWLATIGKDKVLTIYETGEERVDRWRPLFSVTCDYVGRALAWGPLIVGGLLYLAYAGEGNEITVMEIRTQEGTWETVMRIQRPGAINALDWHTDGLLAAALSNGTVSIVDLAYLQTGVAVNEMDYNWQRQALTSFTEIRRNRGTNMMRAVRWIPSAPGSDSLLAVGGSDGELEIVDLTERQRCRGYTQG
jgi:WD40 repeat protein